MRFRFQSTCPRGARRAAAWIRCAEIFQSTCPRGARPRTAHTTNQQRYFNPRAHEGHDQTQLSRWWLWTHFNPRAHEGHDFWKPFLPQYYPISIHVPTRGTTSSSSSRSSSSDPISIHVPTRGTTTITSSVNVRLPFQSTCPRGARPGQTGSASGTVYFNPRAHEGHDELADHIERYIRISIHVPTRGTTKQISTGPAYRYFNPRAHEGHDVVLADVLDDVAFQSTCPRGARRWLSRWLHHPTQISIHVPTRGTTHLA